MNLRKKIVDDLKAAMKAGDTVKRDTLRFLDSMIKNVEIEKKKREAGLNDEETIAVISRSVKQRKESIEQYEKGGRPELAEKEKKELEILAGYMPAQMSEAEIRAEVDRFVGEFGAAGTGKIMGSVMAKLKGKADGNLVRKIVEEKLRK